MEGHHSNHIPGMSPETQMNNTGGSTMMMMMMRTEGHMTFFWSKNAEILFSGWPGTRTGMYVLALIFVFLMSVLLEWLSQYSKNNSNNQYWKKKDGSSSSSAAAAAAMILVTVVHGVKIGVAYLVMLAVMSFNVGIFVVALAGHTVGFLIFASKKTTSSLSSSPNISRGNSLNSHNSL